MMKIKLAELRAKKGISQDAVANFLTMDTSNYNRREKGQTNISKKEWIKIAEFLNVSLEEIYESDENTVFIFNDANTRNGNIVTNYNMPQFVLDSQKKYIEKLEEENLQLKNENKKLKGHLDK